MAAWENGLYSTGSQAFNMVAYKSKLTLYGNPSRVGLDFFNALDKLWTCTHHFQHSFFNSAQSNIFERPTNITERVQLP